MKKRIKALLSLCLLMCILTSCNAQQSAHQTKPKAKTTQKTTHKKKKTTQPKAKKPVKTKKTAQPTSTAPLLATEPYKTQVIATYYHDKFNGRKTASGAIFNNEKQTAAHRTLPFGTQLKVINRMNGKWIYVTVNDRGPVKTTREIDLTKRAFMDITDNTNKGELLVDIELVQQPK